ncbi:unnamed protein product [marine sediment metagenome]|uniref:Uncharacterized protein n=1 Tax=marine sediment metagenome TaxID=412755 RepID=X1BZI5_9ZZZZ
MTNDSKMLIALCIVFGILALLITMHGIAHVFYHDFYVEWYKIFASFTAIVGITTLIIFRRVLIRINSPALTTRTAEGRGQ